MGEAPETIQVSTGATDVSPPESDASPNRSPSREPALDHGSARFTAWQPCAAIEYQQLRYRGWHFGSLALPNMAPLKTKNSAEGRSFEPKKLNVRLRIETELLLAAVGG